MSHSRNSQAIRDLRASRADQADRDREANEIIRELADLDEGACVQDAIDNDVTDRVQISSMDARLSEIVDAHDATAPLFPEFGPPETSGLLYSLEDYQAGLEVTQELPALNDEPNWLQTIRMGIVDALKEVI
jgi:hypothetical protein